MKSLINSNMDTTLENAVHGKRYKISKVEGHATLCERLTELGFCAEEEVEIQQQLLWGGPFIVSVRGTQVALRLSEAQCIHIQTT